MKLYYIMKKFYVERFIYILWEDCKWCIFAILFGISCNYISLLLNELPPPSQEYIDDVLNSSEIYLLLQYKSVENTTLFTY